MEGRRKELERKRRERAREMSILWTHPNQGVRKRCLPQILIALQLSTLTNYLHHSLHDYIVTLYDLFLGCLNILLKLCVLVVASLRAPPLPLAVCCRDL